MPARTAPLVATRPRFGYVVRLLAETDGIALMHTGWMVPGRETSQHAIEVWIDGADPLRPPSARPLPVK